MRGQVRFIVAVEGEEKFRPVIEIDISDGAGRSSTMRFECTLSSDEEALADKIILYVADILSGKYERREANPNIDLDS